MVLSMDAVIYLLGMAASAGAILSRISALEKKVEKHNGVLERMVRMEGEVKAIKELL